MASQLNETIFAWAREFGSAARSFTGIAWLRRGAIAAFVTLLLLVLGVSPCGEGSAPAADDQIDVQAVDEFMQSEMSELHIPGLAVAVVAGALAA